jgi:hypothetical protein
MTTPTTRSSPDISIRYDEGYTPVPLLPALSLALSTGSATLYAVLPDAVEGVPSARERKYLIVGGREIGGLLIDLPNRKWQAAKGAHFALAGKRERIRKALAALERATFSSGLDAATVRWIAEDPDLEDL